ncbi:MAG TPA: hypothetical protein VGB59_06505 [Allosphingosinicella sp.]|jgi:hypothetical protein
MAIANLLKRVGKAVPVIVANAPALVAAAKEIREAVKKQKRRPGEDAA